MTIYLFILGLSDSLGVRDYIKQMNIATLLV